MNRWTLVVALLADPVGMTRLLIEALNRWPHQARKHELSDDVQRRRWKR